MEYLVAVGSTDGKVVNEHFGRCQRYLVFKIDDAGNSYDFVGFRSVLPVCRGGEHSEADFESVYEALSDCRFVLVSRIGPSADRFMRTKGLAVLENGGFIDDALKKIADFSKKQIR